MKPPKCTMDTSCVIALDALDLLPQLSFLFERVLLPKAVRTEYRRRQTKDRLRNLPVHALSLSAAANTIAVLSTYC